jgi:hypothetical protein
MTTPVCAKLPARAGVGVRVGAERALQLRKGAPGRGSAKLPFVAIGVELGRSLTTGRLSLRTVLLLAALAI